MYTALGEISYETFVTKYLNKVPAWNLDAIVADTASYDPTPLQTLKDYLTRAQLYNGLAVQSSPISQSLTNDQLLSAPSLDELWNQVKQQQDAPVYQSKADPTYFYIPETQEEKALGNPVIPIVDNSNITTPVPPPTEQASGSGAGLLIAGLILLAVL